MDKLAGKAGIFAPSIYCIILVLFRCIPKLNNGMPYKGVTQG
jgi:hypothetical protein